MNIYNKLAHKSIVLHIAFCQQGCIFQLQHLAPIHKGFRGRLNTRMQVCTYVHIITHARTRANKHTRTQMLYREVKGGRIKQNKTKTKKTKHWIGSKVNSCIISAMGLGRCIPTVKTQQLIILLQIPGSPSFYWRVHSCCFFKDI